MRITHARALPFRCNARQEVLTKIMYRLVGQHFVPPRVSIIAICYYPRIRNQLRRQITKPECPIVGRPRLFEVAVEPMYRDDTEESVNS